VAARALTFPRRSGDPNVARGSHARLHPRCFVQGGVEAEARASESAEASGASACCHGAGADADLQGAAGEVRGGGGAAPGGAWRRRCSV